MLDNTNYERLEDWFGFSLKHLLMILVATILFGFYIGSLFYGENSVTALKRLEQEKKELKEEAKRLKRENQRLQKRYFELLQLSD